MAEASPIQPSDSQPTVQQVPKAADPATAGLVAQGNAPKKSYSTLDTVASLSDLRQKAPDVYQGMLQGIASSMISSMRRAAWRLRQQWRKGRDRD